MTRDIDETHDPNRRSWVASANGHAEFPIQNLPFGVFRRRGSRAPSRLGVAIGDHILDLTMCRADGRLDDLPEAIRRALGSLSLNALMASGPRPLRQLRHRLVRLLDAREWAGDPRLLVPTCDAELLLPAAIGDYTDFYASIHHATNVGRLFRPDQPLQPNYRHLPVGYHGRSSSIVPSGTAIVRPSGQSIPSGASAPMFGPTQRLDYELEIGSLIGVGNAHGQTIALDDAEDHVFGICLVNDWSARDIQAWESQPLGPFLAKSFATTVSPWVVTLDALAPFRVPAEPRGRDAPALLPYLASPVNERSGAIDITCDVWLSSARMRDAGIEPMHMSHNEFRHMYWTLAQLVAHHASNGCNLRPGDLIGSGTISGPNEGAFGCLLERTPREQPLELPTGETRDYLADGDEVIIRAACRRHGFMSIGFGDCRGRIVGRSAAVGWPPAGDGTGI